MHKCTHLKKQKKEKNKTTLNHDATNIIFGIALPMSNVDPVTNTTFGIMAQHL